MSSLEFDTLRMLASFLCGVLISQSGTLVQSITQNPLASPTTFGFPSMIVLVVLVINTFNLGFPLEYSSLVIGGAILGVVAILVFAVDKKKGEHTYSNQVRSSIERVLLLGLGINLFVGAIFAIWHFVFMAINKSFPTQIWFGNFRFVDSQTCFILSLFTVGNFILITRILNKIQALSLGVSFFSSLDQSLPKLQKQVLCLAFLQTLVIVSLFGVFSFAALVFPTILRRFSIFRRSIAKELILGSLLGGLAFLILDLACYNFPILGAEVPVGMLSATLGSLVMIVLLLCQKS